MEFYNSLGFGICLSAAAGFRGFTPLLVLSVVSYIGMFQPPQGFAWLSNGPVSILFSIALVSEMILSYIAFTKAFVNVVKVTLAVMIGTFLMAAVVAEIAPVFRWAIAIFLGGGAAGILQGMNALIRDMEKDSNAIYQILISGLELIFSLVISLFGILFPVFSGAVILFFILFVLKRIFFRSLRKEMLS
ncbi:conserved hypothetical protein [Chloroherpeton thalassium ATCC 35110]|uniref:DUF4126 domain-containing protein n=1 Tax=Chloroherpeton thalassium (strain ATCC 35110 / GB-78) TaxID=517418 RepID=B3QX22_CHLT3|nr:DUF4126 domain-containing protein [Chloroherpeton thalassium]ACF14832.1 conserved hypothetical protein [Chloroherpeton thalassium ATCC 35110]